MAASLSSVSSEMVQRSWSVWFFFICLLLGSHATDEVTICHNPGSANPQTLTVASKVLEGYLNQGDYVGRCSHEEPVSPDEVAQVCAQKDLPICQCPGEYDWRDDGRECATHCMAVLEGVCYPGLTGIPASEAQCGKFECRPGHVRCRKPDLEPVSLEFCASRAESLHRHLLTVPSPSASPSEYPSPSESPSPLEFPIECCEDLPVCQCHDDYDYQDFGTVCDTHCMELDRRYCHPGKAADSTDLTPCTRYACAAGQVRCRRPAVIIPPPPPRDPRTFFLARGGESCDDACAAVSLVCDADLVSEVALTLDACKDVLEHLNMSIPLGGEYDEDNSGCTYHPDAPGWYQVFKKDGAPPKCSERNPDLDRLRVCACQALREVCRATTGPPMGFNVTSTPSPRVLSRPGQFSPSPAWSPAVTSSWHSVWHVSPEHWSPACTPGGGSDRQQDSPHLPPVLLAPLFESAMSTPRRDSTQSASDEDVQQYAVRCSTPPDLPPTLLAPLFESVMSASRAGSTHRECDEDMGQYEVQYSTPPSVGERPPNPFTFPSLRGAQRLCTELPGMARQGQGWVRDPHARHSTMLYSMQEGALSPNSAEGLMKHGRASREAT